MRVKVKVPASLKDISLSQYQKFLRTTEGSEDNYFINKQMVGIFCNLPDTVVDVMRQSDFESILKQLGILLGTKCEFQPTIKHKFKNYGFIPNLQEITVGEQADAESYIKDWQKMDKAMAVLYRPIKDRKGDKYTIDQYTGNEDPLDLSLDIVFGSMVFFYNLWNDCVNYIQNSIKEEVVTNKKLQTLVKNGDGIKTFMHSLEATFSSMKAFQNYYYTKPYYSSPLNPIKTG